jgi:hypothetical protein
MADGMSLGVKWLTSKNVIFGNRLELFLTTKFVEYCRRNNKNQDEIPMRVMTAGMADY